MCARGTFYGLHPTTPPTVRVLIGGGVASPGNGAFVSKPPPQAGSLLLSLVIFTWCWFPTSKACKLYLIMHQSIDSLAHVFWQVALWIYEKQMWNMQMSFVGSSCLVLLPGFNQAVSGDAGMCDLRPRPPVWCLTGTEGQGCSAGAVLDEVLLQVLRVWLSTWHEFLRKSFLI